MNRARVNGKAASFPSQQKAVSPGLGDTAFCCVFSQTAGMGEITLTWITSMEYALSEII
jgi:hypothetical protein